MWKKEGITKGDLIEYYSKVASRLVPFMTDRPAWVQRFPNGIPGKGFVQKDWPVHPPWVKIAPVPSHEKAVRHVIADDEATLVWLGDMACLEINNHLSRLPKLESHDLVLVDLDPHPPRIEFEDVLEVAENVRVALKQMKLRHIMKTSGSEGMHFLIPIIPKYTLDTIKKFVHQLGIVLEELSPKKVTTSRHRRQRLGKIFIDYDQNTRNSIVTPFSPRPTRGAPVSFPLSANDLKKRFEPPDYNLRSVSELADEGKLPDADPGPGQTLDGAFKELGLVS
ncbi:MAG TPA: hypothetical protein VFE98_01290 [Candidatus Bathyarchaeia archaeon]|nr:hypothetical protein [Candidatus Bathyarchaeia archaeon]